MKTNVFTDEEAEHKDPEIGQHLENLIDRISNSLSGTALDFYKREFDFFDKVTSVSGTIRCVNRNYFIFYSFSVFPLAKSLQFWKSGYSAKSVKSLEDARAIPIDLIAKR